MLLLYLHRSLSIWYRALGSDGGTSAGCSSSRLFARARSCAGTGAAYPPRHLECDSRTFLRVWGGCLGQERLSMRECCVLHHAIFALDLLPFIGMEKRRSMHVCRGTNHSITTPHHLRGRPSRPFHHQAPTDCRNALRWS